MCILTNFKYAFLLCSMLTATCIIMKNREQERKVPIWQAIKPGKENLPFIKFTNNPESHMEM